MPLLLRLALLIVALPLAGCGGEPARQPDAGPMPMPALADVLSSNMTDRSCACVERGECTLLDAVPGSFEGRNLECRVISRRERLVACRLEERFVEIDFEGPDRPGRWAAREVRLREGARGWCVPDRAVIVGIGRAKPDRDRPLAIGRVRVRATPFLSEIVAGQALAAVSRAT